ERRAFADFEMAFGDILDWTVLQRTLEGRARRGEHLIDRRHRGRADGDRIRLEDRQVLENVQKVDFGPELLGERRAVAERVFRVFAEVGGDEDTVESDHDDVTCG